MSDEIYGESDEPRFTIERAAEAALQAAQTAVEQAGGEVVHIFVAVRATGVGLPDTTAAGHGFQDAEGLLMELLEIAAKSARQIGLQIHIVPIGTPMGQG